MTRNFHFWENGPDEEVSYANSRSSPPSPTTKKVSRIRAENRSVSRLPNSRKESTQAPLNLGKNLLSRETIIRRQAILGATSKPISSFREPMVPTQSLKLELHTTPCARIRRYFICPLTSPIRLNALLSSENSNPRAARKTPYFVRAPGRTRNLD